jgi:hypothetical protein
MKSYIPKVVPKPQISPKIGPNNTIFIIGSGPCLNDIDVSKLSEANTFCMNRQYISFKDWGFQPTYYACMDRKLIATIHPDIKAIASDPKCEVEKFFIGEFGENNPIEELENVVSIPYMSNTINIPNSRLYQNKVLGYWGNCGAFCTTLAYYLGYRRIVLCGINANYSGRQESITVGKDLEHYNPNYFHPDSFVEGKNQGSPDAMSSVDPWKYMKDGIKSPGIDPSEHSHLYRTAKIEGTDFEIISCSPGSAINNFFEYKELEELI